MAWAEGEEYPTSPVMRPVHL